MTLPHDATPQKRHDRKAPRLSRTLYPLRTLGMVLQVVGVLPTWWYFGAPPTLWIAATLVLVWPHIAYLNSLGKDHGVELRHLPVDAFLCGITVPIISFNPVPTTAMVSTLVISVVGTGGRRALGSAGLALAAGLGVSTLYHGFHFLPDTPLMSVLVCAPTFLLFPAFVGMTSYRLTREIAAIRRTLATEKTLSETLLLNVLPGPIAERLKLDPSHIAERYDAVTILFADIVGFTPLAQTLSAEETVGLLNRLFTAFDDLAERHGLEKIKTIGDAYMAVAGLPERRDDHAPAAAAMALDMLAVVERLGEGKLQVRVGLNSGPVVAGVIGKKKFSYDLWGDAVNTASRMESHGEPGKIHLTTATRDLLAGTHEVVARGAIVVKGKGEMETCFLVGQVSA